MKTFGKYIAALLLSVLVFTSFTTVAGADTTGQKQEINQNVKVNCSVGSYGQSTECTAEGTQNAKQEFITRADGIKIRKHKVAATSMNQTVLMAVAVTAIGTMGLGLVSLKKRSI